MKIAIAGAGLTGAYLYRLLRNQRDDVDVFARDPGTKCGINPCAWGTSRGFAELVKASALEPARYIKRRFDYVAIDERKIKGELMTFDKPRLVKDLLDGAEIKDSSLNPAAYDRIIDATGVSRAFLPRIQDDIILPCIQWRIQAGTLPENRIKLGRIGYAWCFPLSNDQYHMGCGSLISDPHKIIAELGWMQSSDQKTRKVICACKGQIRLTAPQYAQPFVTGNRVWGVGESIGCVAPLAGDGVIPGMKSVQILLKWWDNPDGYTKAILKEFSWMKSERRVIDKLRANEPLDVSDAWVLRRNSRRMGMQVGLKEAGFLLKRLR